MSIIVERTCIDNRVQFATVINVLLLDNDHHENLHNISPKCFFSLFQQETDNSDDRFSIRT